MPTIGLLGIHAFAHTSFARAHQRVVSTRSWGVADEEMPDASLMVAACVWEEIVRRNEL